MSSVNCLDECINRRKDQESDDFCSGSVWIRKRCREEPKPLLPTQREKTLFFFLVVACAMMVAAREGEKAGDGRFGLEVEIQPHDRSEADEESRADSHPIPEVSLLLFLGLRNEFVHTEIQQDTQGESDPCRLPRDQCSDESAEDEEDGHEEEEEERLPEAVQRARDLDPTRHPQEKDRDGEPHRDHEGRNTTTEFVDDPDQDSVEEAIEHGRDRDRCTGEPGIILVRPEGASLWRGWTVDVTRTMSCRGPVFRIRGTLGTTREERLLLPPMGGGIGLHSRDHDLVQGQTLQVAEDDPTEETQEQRQQDILPMEIFIGPWPGDEERKQFDGHRSQEHPRTEMLEDIDRELGRFPAQEIPSQDAEPTEGWKKNR